VTNEVVEKPVPVVVAKSASVPVELFVQFAELRIAAFAAATFAAVTGPYAVKVLVPLY